MIRAIPTHIGDFTDEDEATIGPIRSNPEPYSFMLIQDIQAQLFPKRLGDELTSVELVLSPPDKRVRLLVEKALDAGSYSPEFSYALRHFLEMSVYDIMQNGRAIYDVAVDIEGSERALRFVPILSQTIFVRWGRWFQYLPLNVRRARGLPRFISIDSEGLMKICAPREYDLPEMDDRLTELGKLSPLTVTGTIDPPDGGFGYSWETHNRLKNITFLKVTHKIGWMARGLHSSNLPAPYQAVRWIKFLRFVAMLREIMIDALNEALRITEREFNVAARIETSGFLPCSAYDEAMVDITNGKLSIKKVLFTLSGA